MSNQNSLCDAADKLHEIRAKISMLRRLFYSSNRPGGEFVEFNAEDCWGVDIVLREIADQLGSTENALLIMSPGLLPGDQ